MSEAVTGTLIGLKIAVFSLAVLFAYMVHDRVEKFDLKWLLLTAAGFLSMSLVELLVDLDRYVEYTALSFVVDPVKQFAVMDALFFISSIGMVLFLRNIKEVLED